MNNLVPHQNDPDRAVIQGGPYNTAPALLRTFADHPGDIGLDGDVHIWMKATKNDR